MEFDEFFVKESPGLCRCCLSEGCYKDLGSEYPWMNETEVYADMLLECFDISITQHNEGPNGPNRLICEVCITRLRDACNFKKQVLESEKKFIDMLGRGEFKPKVLIYQTQMKKEQSEELPEEEVEYLEHEMDFDDGEVIEPAETEEPPPVETVTAETLTLKRTLRTLKKGKVGRPKKQAVTDDKPRTSKAVAKGKKPNDKKSLSSTMRNRMMRENAVAIIESSTAVPFKWQQQDYLCFNCHLPFKDIKPLKEHARENHKRSSVKTAVSCLKMDDKVKIDVTDATCKHCDEDFRNLQSFVEHLKNVHDIKVSDKFGYGVVPYSFPADEVICGVCNEGFKYFINANKHMNQHFRDYVCEECGKAFMSYDRLRAHNLMHGAKFRCRFCTDTFESVVKRKVHEAKNHDRSGRVQCSQCSETFSNYNKRKKHLSLVHKVDIPMFNCTVCGKVYPCRSRMERHFRAVHVKERNVACTMCDSKFFSRADVRKHMKRHVGLTVHQCKICKKSYVRKQTLNDHMKTHFK